MTQRFSNRAAAIYRLPLHTPQLIVRALKPCDDKAVAAFCAANDGAFMKRWYVDFKDKPVTASNLKTAMEKTFKDNLYLFMFRKGTGKIIGLLELFEDQKLRPRISYFTLPSERGNGYAFESYKACFNQGVESGLLKNSLYAHTDPDNKASQHFLKSAGFHTIGTKTIRHPFNNTSWDVTSFVHPITDSTRIRQKIHIPD